MNIYLLIYLYHFSTKNDTLNLIFIKMSIDIDHKFQKISVYLSTINEICIEYGKDLKIMNIYSELPDFIQKLNEYRQNDQYVVAIVYHKLNEDIQKHINENKDYYVSYGDMTLFHRNKYLGLELFTPLSLIKTFIETNDSWDIKCKICNETLEDKDTNSCMICNIIFCSKCFIKNNKKCINNHEN